MSNIGSNHPSNPFSATGRAAGKSNQQLNNLGLNGQGHPLPSQPPKGQVKAPSGPGGSRGQGIAQLAQAIGDLDLSNQHDIHAFCESIRKVQHYFAVSVELAKGQLKAAARAQAKDSADGRLTLTQKLELAKALNSLSRDLNAVTRGCVASATASAKAYRRFESFLVDLNTDAQRPGGRRGGFEIV
jgi:hypothetical protein